MKILHFIFFLAISGNVQSDETGTDLNSDNPTNITITQTSVKPVDLVTQSTLKSTSIIMEILSITAEVPTKTAKITLGSSMETNQKTTIVSETTETTKLSEATFPTTRQSTTLQTETTKGPTSSNNPPTETTENHPTIETTQSSTTTDPVVTFPGVETTRSEIPSTEASKYPEDNSGEKAKGPTWAYVFFSLLISFAFIFTGLYFIRRYCLKKRREDQLKLLKVQEGFFMGASRYQDDDINL